MDDIAVHLVGRVYRSSPEETEPWLNRWVESDQLWLRRSAIICQVTAKSTANFEMLSRFIVICINEREFFITKAIGWALRDQSRHRPDEVRAFIEAHRDELAPLSIREGAKYL